MIRFIYITILLEIFAIEQGVAQKSDFLTLHNKQGITIKTFLPGVSLVLGDINGQTIAGRIHTIYHDTIFVDQFDIRRVYDRWGMSVLDTVTTYTIKVAYKDIQWILKPTRSFEYIRNGTFFVIGGAGYSFLHLFNSIQKKQPIDVRTLAISSGVALSGWILPKYRQPTYRIGPKYPLIYIKMTE
jgi:hypothetical protein